MIGIRLTQGDSGVRRYFEVVRDGEAVFVNHVDVKLRCPSGAVKTGTGVLDPDATSQFFVEFGSLDLTLTESGTHWLELVINGEHEEDPIEVWVRPEFVEGPR